MCLVKYFQKIAALLLVVAHALCLAVVFGLYGYAQLNVMSKLETAFYIGISRLTWAVGISIGILLFFHGHGGMLYFH